MSTDSIIEVEGLYKRYGLPPFWPWKKHEVQDHEWALRDINFNIPRGGSLGILGRNGAGKSTLLKLLAGVTPPDKGHIKINGSIFPMIELSAGMSMELSGRENIHILGTIMGLSSTQIAGIIPKVEEFSELEEWLLKPVWQYSSGMVARLAFGIAVNMRADILLVDEVLSVGDIMFQKKCQIKVQELLGDGTTLIFVSHSPYQVERLCEEALLLDHGNILRNGDVTSVMQEYLARTVVKGMQGLSVSNGNSSCLPPEHRAGTGDIRFISASIQSSLDEEDHQQIYVGDTVCIVLKYDAKIDISNFNLNIRIVNLQGATVALLGALPGERPDVLPMGLGEIRCLLKEFPLMGGFVLSASIKTTYLLDSAENILCFTSIADGQKLTRTNNIGDLYMEPTWKFIPQSDDISKTQQFDTADLKQQDLQIYYYKDEFGNFDYEKYKEVQIATNIRKLDKTSIDDGDIQMLSGWLCDNISPLARGLCHGTRNGKEQKLFKEFTGAQVLGTDISPTATQFPDTIQHDFHEIKSEWIDHFDFIFSNSYDHSYNLEYCIKQWFRCLRPGGICILEHSNGYVDAKESDPIGITREALCRLLDYWGQGEFVVDKIIDATDKNYVSKASFLYEGQAFIMVRKIKK